MARLNRDAAEAMVEAGARAATDITGFGLLGHAHGLAEASGVTVEIDAGKVPCLPGAMDLGRKGLFTRAAKSNPEYLADKVVIDPRVDSTTATMLYDAQTSGGLLIAIPAERADALTAALKSRGVPTISVIGRVGPAGEKPITVRP
jgi:selenide,water dikinase